MSEVLQAFYKISPVLLIFEESRKTIASARSDDFRRRYCRKSNKRTVEELFQGKHLRTRTGVGAIFVLLLTLGVFDLAVSWSTLKSWSTFRIRLVLHEISWSTKDVSRNYGDIFREVNHAMALLRQLRRCSSRQVLQILINIK